MILRAEDYRGLAQSKLDPEVWDFVDGGSGDEITLRANLQAFADVRLRPRMLVDVAKVSTSLTLLGAELPAPIGIAPVAYHKLMHPEGELATAKALNGAPMVVSIFASQRLEAVAEVATGPLWMQLYWLQRREVLVDLIDRAERAGYQGIVFTVDAPRIGRRLRDQRNGFTLPHDVTAVNIDPEVMSSSHEKIAGASAIATHALQTFDQTVTWADLAWLRERTRLPLILKGILTGEDARLAVRHGASAVVVSNHGGRQLDRAMPSLHALAEVTSAVADEIPVLFDGGVRSGADVFIALALGATAVLLGRTMLWALAADGAEGVAGMLRLMRDELEHTMAMTGRPELSKVDATALRLSWS